MTYTNVPDVRRVANVLSTDFSDAQIEEMISLAQKEVTSRVQTKVVREPVYGIDQYRQNNIDGVNTTYFIRNWKGNYLGDLNYDNQVDTSDVIVTQFDPNTHTETELTVASIDYENCSLTLSTAPQSVQLFITYCYVPFDEINPDPFIQQATAYLAGSYLFVGSDGFETSFGNVTIKPGRLGGKGEQMYKKYTLLLDQLLVVSNNAAIVSEMTKVI
jgi:hypothetical protein